MNLMNKTIDYLNKLITNTSEKDSSDSGQINGREVVLGTTSDFGEKELPIELISHILGFLSPFELSKMKLVCTTFSKLASELAKRSAAYQIALQNLEIARPILLTVISENRNECYLKHVNHVKFNKVKLTGIRDLVTELYLIKKAILEHVGDSALVYTKEKMILMFLCLREFQIQRIFRTEQQV